MNFTRNKFLWVLGLLVLATNVRQSIGFFDVFSIESNDVKESEVPFIGSLRDKFNNYFCPATIISQNWALTTAKCVYFLSTFHTVLITGTSSIINGGQAHKINKFYIHPKFSHENWLHDIALVNIEGSSSSGDKKRAIKSIEIGNGADENENLNLYGWGFVKNYGVPVHHINMQKVILKKASVDECTSMLPNFLTQSFNQTNVICAKTGGKYDGNCSIDSGAPVVASGKLIGISSTTRPCIVGESSAFLPLSMYDEWIKETISGEID